MYTKTCPTCTKPSYSSSEFSRWICPTCSTDLTSQKEYVALCHQPTKYERKKQLTLYVKSYKIDRVI